MRKMVVRKKPPSLLDLENGKRGLTTTLVNPSEDFNPFAFFAMKN